MAISPPTVDRPRLAWWPRFGRSLIVVGAVHAVPILLIVISVISARSDRPCVDCHALEGIFMAFATIAVAVSLVACVIAVAILVSFGLRDPWITGALGTVMGGGLAVIALAIWLY